ncbi:porin [Pseudoduganella eburnea]|jgi:predicted porin|uniref:Porin n=1 Tax=Massilia eburnea TaxID=1776165 RepID=A0A6L6QHP8_9BURK|nr:porin [Massilia eburnea]MTW11779.1 porin [Massilia eburnea]
MKYTTATLLALACCSAHAQSNVAIYGVVDAGLVLERGTPAGNTSNVSSGVASGSRLGFKGTEDLGNGLSAGFVVESGFGIDTGASGQGGLTFGRQSFVSLSSNTLGTISAGRQYSPYYKLLRDIGDPFSDGLAGQAPNLMVPNRRMDNSLVYASPTLAGWSAGLAYSAGEVAGDMTRKRALSGAINYEQGPLNVGLAHFRRESATAAQHAYNTLLAARYKLGNYTLHAAFADNRGMGTVGGGGTSLLAGGGSGTITTATTVITNATVGTPGASSRDVVLGLCANFGPHSFAGSVVQHLDRSPANQDARQYGVAYLYALSKRTDLYTAFARINGRNGAPFTVGNATDDGKGHSAFNLGLRHLL